MVRREGADLDAVVRVDHARLDVVRVEGMPAGGSFSSSMRVRMSSAKAAVRFFVMATVPFGP